MDSQESFPPPPFERIISRWVTTVRKNHFTVGLCFTGLDWCRLKFAQPQRGRFGFPVGAQAQLPADRAEHVLCALCPPGSWNSRKRRERFPSLGEEVPAGAAECLGHLQATPDHRQSPGSLANTYLLGTRGPQRVGSNARGSEVQLLR